jgi:hypothetical protein
MPIAFRVDEEHGVVITTWTGRVSIEDQIRHWLALLNDPRATAMRRSVVDLRQGVPTFTGAEMRDALATLEQKFVGPRWTTAIVVANAHQFGVSRQFEVLAATVTKDEIFEEMEAALTWVKNQPA